jgi:hypothetical protein
MATFEVRVTLRMRLCTVQKISRVVGAKLTPAFNRNGGAERPILLPLKGGSTILNTGQVIVSLIAVYRI